MHLPLLASSLHFAIQFFLLHIPKNVQKQLTVNILFLFFANDHIYTYYFVPMLCFISTKFAPAFASDKFFYLINPFFCHWCLSIPPEKFRKHCFSDVFRRYRKTCGMKWINKMWLARIIEICSSFTTFVSGIHLSVTHRSLLQCNGNKICKTVYSTPFSSIFHFCSPSKRQKTTLFLRFSGSIEWNIGL